MPSEDTYFKPGKSGNPQGSAKGKRISTWMVELGSMNPCRWPDPSELPANALIAIERLKAAMTDEGCRDTQLIAEMTESKTQPAAVNIVMPDQRQSIINKLDELEKPIAPHANA